jgi:hypothetical protein
MAKNAIFTRSLSARSEIDQIDAQKAAASRQSGRMPRNMT